MASQSIGIYLDSNAIIHFVEVLDRGIEPLVRLVANEAMRLHTSELALAEVLVRPFQLGNTALSAIYEQFLSPGSSVAVETITRDILVLSARNRADFGNKEVDAVHIATAMSTACVVFVSGDKRIRCPAGLDRWEVDRLLDWAATR